MAKMKKMMMEKTFKPENVEKKIYALWEKGGYFTAKIDKRKKPFTIIMPPPNANAPVHIGFGVNVAVEDLLTRYHRMCGEAALWLPGADHAGILSQVVYERQLAKKGQTRHDLGRAEFYQAVMKFTLDNQETMQTQLRALGASCDWSRDAFTLDAKFDRPIYTVFKKLYDEGLIYRAERMINWCPRCETALSDLEVEHGEEKSRLWHLSYPLKSGMGQVVVATTRPETMLGDTAIAVNPQDKRYRQLVGQLVVLPLVNREIPIIADDAVDPKFGTGALKVTPAHDPVDLQLGQKHKLATVAVIGFDGRLTEAAGSYAGLEVMTARERILADLKKLGRLVKEEAYTHSVGHCERCKTTIEPLISTQWFVKTKSLAQPAIEAVKKGQVKIVPRRFEKIYFNWLENIRDWCISRQLWWGHQFPVWYCLNPKCSGLTAEKIQKLVDDRGLVLPIVKREIYRQLKPIVSIDPPAKCPDCSGGKLFRDPDTLDTWFSSGQWPFNTLGWIDNAEDYQYFYPTTVMETGYEILFFWVARMIMLGLYVTGEVPFKVVYLHGMVRDAFGKKMSKSRPETAIDPMETIKEYGADALRMALVTGNAPGSDSSLSEDKIRGMRNFANKVWNIGRFILLGFEKADGPVPFYSESLESRLVKVDRQILNDLNKLIKKTTDYLEQYRFDFAAEGLYHFIWHRLADEYVEESKERVGNGDVLTLSVLRHVYLNCLKLLHPFMPFVTEEIWQRFPRMKKDPLIISSWPRVKKVAN